MKAALGVDIGTQGTKAGVYLEDGTLVAYEYAAHEFWYPQPGWVELDPAQIEHAVTSAIAGAVLQAGRHGIPAGSITAMSCSGICCGPVLIDDDWVPVRRIIPFLDVRAQEEVAQIREGVEPRWVQECGTSTIDTYVAPATIHWVRNHEPQAHQRIARVLSLAPYIAGRLAGLKAEQAFTDPTHLSGWIIGWDAQTADFSPQQIHDLAIEPAVLPKVVSSSQVIGAISPEAAARTGLAPGTLIAAGAGDIMQSNLAAGFVESGQATDVAGTASLLTVGVPGLNERLSRIPGMLYSLGTLPGQAFYWGYVKAGGLSLRWFRDQVIGQSHDEGFYSALDERAARVPVGADGVLFFPYLSGGGPGLADANGTWLGLRTASDTAVLWRSLLESIAFEYASFLSAFREEGIVLEEVRAVGGGARSDLWNQIKADVTGLPWRTPSRQDGAILANAALALVSSGEKSDLRSVVEAWVKADRVAKPVHDAHRRYRSISSLRQHLLTGDLGRVLAQVAQTTGGNT